MKEIQKSYFMKITQPLFNIIKRYIFIDNLYTRINLNEQTANFDLSKLLDPDRMIKTIKLMLGQ